MGEVPLRTSASFKQQWSTSLQESASTQACLIVYKYITHVIFKELIKQQFPIKEVADKGGDHSLTFEELNGMLPDMYLEFCVKIHSRIS